MPGISFQESLAMFLSSDGCARKDQVDNIKYVQSSVILQFSFHQFLNQGNHQKPVWNPETQSLGDLCPIFRKPLGERGMETYGTYGNLRNSIYVMQEKHWLN